MKPSTDRKHSELFRKNLQGFMDDMGMSGLGTAKTSGVSQKTVWSVCTGRSAPTLNTAHRVAKAVGVDAALLQIKPLTPSQVGRSKQVARLTAELFDLSAADLSAVRKFVSGMQKPKHAVKQYALLSETENE
jgi:DNA-binding XRE family transcriptional regulator